MRLVRSHIALLLVFAFAGVLLFATSQPSAAASPPSVFSISPASGPVAGGTLITILGQNLAGTTYVDFDGQHIVPSSMSANQLKVTSPVHGAGVVHLRVQTGDGLSAQTAADNYRYLNQPVVSSVSPAGGSTAGGTTVTIRGSNLLGAYQVIFGDIPASPFQVSQDTVVVTSPAHAAGIVDVRVRTAGGVSDLSAGDRYTYAADGPAVATISPRNGSTAGGTIITITGTHFAGALAVSFGTQLVAPYSVSDTEIIVVSPPHASGVVHLRVTTAAGVSPETANDNYTYVTGLPVVFLISPRTGPVEGGTVVTISGSGFAGALNVQFGEQLVAPTAVSETSLTVVAPPHAAGLVHLRVTTSIGISEATAQDDYTYGGGGPRVQGISPESGPTSGGTVVTITGTGFAGATGVSFNGQLIAPTSVTTTQVVVVTPPHAAGIVHLRVIAPGGISPETSLDDYTYGGLPQVLSISPTSGSVDGGTLITITGSSFTGAKSVSFGDISVAPFFVNENTLQVVSPAVAMSFCGVRTPRSCGRRALP